MHRMEVPECIYESLGRGDASQSDDEFDAAINNLSQQIKAAFIEVQRLTELERWILGDCLDCGTYWSCHEYESDQKRAGLNRIGWSLVEKFEANQIPVLRDHLIFC